MSDDFRPLEVRAYEQARFEEPLAHPDVQHRRRALDDIIAHGYTPAIPRLIPMLAFDEPYVFTRRGVQYIAELRAHVLETLGALYWLQGKPADFGPVKERMPMPAADAIAAARAATASMSDGERAALAGPIDTWLATQHIESPAEREALRAFRTLQALGKIEYRLEHVDPETLVTPLQQEIIDDQTRAPRPLPHVRVARQGKPDETLGWIYRMQDGEWVVDFSDAFDAREVARTARSIMGGKHHGAVANVVFDLSGQPIKNPSGSFKSDRLIPLDSPETVDILRSAHARLGEFEDAELNL